MSGYHSTQANGRRGMQPGTQPLQPKWSHQSQPYIDSTFDRYTYMQSNAAAPTAMDVDYLPGLDDNRTGWEDVASNPYPGQDAQLTTTNSYLDVSNCSWTNAMKSTPSSDSWTNMHKSSYSEVSNRISDTHSGDLLPSVHGSSQGHPDEWVHGASYEVETEGPSEDVTFMPHNQGAVLLDMSTSISSQNSHQYMAAGEDCFESQSIYQPHVIQFTYHEPEPHRHGALPIQIARGSSGPWNQLEPKVTDPNPGFSAFTPATPGRVQDDDNSSREYPQTLGSIGRSRAPRTPSPRGRPRAQGSQALIPDLELGWDNQTLMADGQIQHQPAAGVSRRGGREGPFSPTKAKKVNKMRELMACWSCWNAKAQCSFDEICERCSKRATPLGAQSTCFRVSFDFYKSAWSPPELFNHLQQSEVELLISDNVKDFVYAVQVGLSTGEVFEPMVLSASVFVPKDAEANKLSRQSYLTTDMPSQLVHTYCAPLGLPSVSISDMKKNCNKHIESMVANSQYATQVTAGDTIGLPRECIEIALMYWRATGSLLLHDVLKLHATQYFMKSLPTFSPESEEVHQRGYISSRLLTRQVKFPMKELQNDILHSVLKELQKSFRLKSSDSWGPSFCSMLILCLCMEGVQIAADVLVVCDNMKEGPASKYTREQSYDACLALENYPFRQLKLIFHDVYKTHNAKGALNPLQSEQDRKFPVSLLNKETRRMVKAIYKRTCREWSQLVEISDRPSFVNMGGEVHPDEIYANNNGRLAAKFLRSFFEEVN